jgi:hypothetical protein
MATNNISYRFVHLVHLVHAADCETPAGAPEEALAAPLAKAACLVASRHAGQTPGRFW